MDNSTVTQADLEAEVLKLKIGLVVLGVVLLIAIVLGVAVVCWLIAKLRQHEGELFSADPEAAKVDKFRRIYSEKQRDNTADSAIELCDGDMDARNGERPTSGISRPTSGMPRTRQARPRMTVKIRAEKANVFGYKPRMSQMMQVTQDFHKSRGFDAEGVGSETVEVVDKDLNKRVLGNTKKRMSVIGRLSTVLLKSETEEVDATFSEDNGLFVHKHIDQSGGKLEVSGVSLEIPSDALHESKLISLGIVWDGRASINLTKKQAKLSPTILCHPNGLRFKKPVTLTFPHCAVNMTADWRPTIMKREGPLEVASDWTPITLEDYEERDVKAETISLRLHHFTLYTCIGESNNNKVAAKVVNLVAFSPKLTRAIAYKPFIYCINYYKELETIEPVMERFASKMADAPMPLFIHDDGNDIMVEVDKMSDGWSVSSNKIERLPFEQVWHAAAPHCTFVFKSKKTPSEISCDFQSYQETRDNQPIKLRIAEQIALPRSPLSSAEDDPVTDVVNELVILLDPPSDTADWRHLAEKTGCDVARINWLKLQESPTRVLVDRWLQEKKTFRELADVMASIERLDAADEIRKRLPSLESDADSDSES